MKNIRYFCSVKCIRALVFATVISVFSLISNNTFAAAQAEMPATNYDSVEISLLTCSPGQEVYSLYGHTAIRIRDLARGTDVAVNYGMFSFRKPFFILRFVFGLTDYEMGVVPFSAFRDEYAAAGRAVYQQTLSLTDEEKAAVIAALRRNYEPQNREYRYNYFYDNCTTRARDMLTGGIGGQVTYQADSTARQPSYRELIHQYNEDSRWSRFGNDLLLGVKADKKAGLAEQQFLPFNLKRDFDKAVITGNDGKSRQLVKSSACVVGAEPIAADKGFPLTPHACAWIALAVTAALTIVEWRVKGNFWMFDTLLLFIAGCAGVILFLMIFSQHPTTSVNLQILLLNPLTLVFLWRASCNMRKRRADRFWIYALSFTALFLFGGIWQSYAEGMYIVASALLIRCLRRLSTLQCKRLDDK